MSLRERLRALPGSAEMLTLFGLVMGGLFSGFFTPTEAGAAGSAAALLLSAGTRRLSLGNLVRSVTDTIKVSSMIMVIILGAVILGRFLAVTRLPYAAADYVAGLDVSPDLVVVIICLIYAVGGMLMDALALLW
jgi:TRAP-type C4-dicarboxylate transport system permease large subunit